MNQKTSWLPFALGIALAVPATLAARADNPGAPGTPELVLATGNADQGRGTRETVFVLDPRSQRLAVYVWSCGTNQLVLGAVRDVKYDLLYEEFTNGPKNVNQSPPVDTVRKEAEEAQQKSKGRTQPPR